MPGGEPIGCARPGAVVLLAVAAALLAGCGEGDGSGGGAKLQTVRFQEPTDPGPDPFTKPADIRGTVRVRLERVGRGPFGGTGSDLVCDRELLISSLKARPDRLREWARVAGVEPTLRAVARYIRGLRPVTLTRDTRVTNHSFAGTRAVAYQAILQAGTAVLVDRDGNPRARCRCGNPLLEPVFFREAKCLGCPARYSPPPPCEPYSECYRRYPDPPAVRTARRRPRPAPAPVPTPAPVEPEPPPPATQPEPEPQPPPEPPPEPTGTECSDGIDNDSGGEIDFPNDPQCTSPDDSSESS